MSKEFIRVERDKLEIIAQEELVRRYLELEEEMKAIEEVRDRFGHLDNDIPEKTEFITLRHVVAVSLHERSVNSIHRGIVHIEGLSFEVETGLWRNISRDNHHGKRISYEGLWNTSFSDFSNSSSSSSSDPSSSSSDEKTTPEQNAFFGKRVEETDKVITCRTTDVLYRNREGVLYGISRIRENVTIIHDGDHPYRVVFRSTDRGKHMGSILTVDDKRQIIRLQDLWTGEEKVYVFAHNGNVVYCFFMFRAQLYGYNKRGVYHIASGLSVVSEEYFPRFRESNYFDGRYMTRYNGPDFHGWERQLEIYEMCYASDFVTPGFMAPDFVTPDSTLSDDI